MHFDRFRPQPLARWREDGGAGSGIWMDLGPHLLDEALLYFGMPVAIHADIRTIRPGARADDAFNATLRYADGLRVDIGASMLAAAPRPRVALHGVRGSYVKQSPDPQEAALKAGRTPDDGMPWGVDAEDGVATVERDGMLHAEASPTVDGAYPDYYRRVREAILGTGPNPVPAQQALAVMRLLDAGRQSGRERREVSLDTGLDDPA